MAPFLAQSLAGDDAASLGVALAIGLLLGLQRERSQRATGKRGPAGARTFPIVALLGALTVLAGGGEPGWLAAVGFVGVAALTTAVARAPKSVDAHNNLGIALGSTGDLTAAIAQFKQALAIDATAVEARRNLEMAEQALAQNSGRRP